MTSSTSIQRPYYSEDTDFAALALEDVDFAAIVNANNGRVDWQDPKALQQLTKALLKRDFSIKLDLPNDRLCPPVPVRWNYVRWLQDLLATTSGSYTDRHDPAREVLGLDIGVGASCIYSFLACSSAPGWRMLGSDVDQHSLDFARKNVEANGMGDRIRLALTTTDSPLIPIDKMSVEELNFVMCNPPFYSSEDDMLAAYGSKAMSPSAVCTGSTNEMICPSGDIGFVTRILDESLKLRTRVQWYSSMLGRLVSVHQLVAKLKEHNITNFAVTNLKPGQKTRRWAVAWSFDDTRPRNDIVRHGELVQAILPLATEWTIQMPGVSAKDAGAKVDTTLRDLDLRWQWRANLFTGVAAAKGNVWSRAARRKKKFDQIAVESGKAKADGSDGDSMSEDEDEEVGLAVKITCSRERVDVRWLRGTDAVLWESFCGMLKRALGARERGTAASATKKEE